MNSQLKNVVLNSVRHYSNLINGYEDGIDFTVGEGHFESPFNAKLKAIEALMNNQTKYGKIEGDDLLRELFINNYYPTYNYQSEVIVTNGSTQGVFSSLLSLLNGEDEVILVSPHYPAYEQMINLLGCKCVIIDTKSNHFKINTELLGYFSNSFTCWLNV